MSGVVVRVAAKVGASVREVFTWMRWFPKDPAKFAANFGTAARIVGSFSVAESSGWGPMVIFKRDVSRDFEDDSSVQRFFAGNRALEHLSLDVNLAQVEPLDEGQTWSLLATSREAGGDREHAMRALLKALPPEQVERFCARIEAWAFQLDTETSLASAGSDFVRGSDGFRAWRFGVIAEGRERFEAARDGKVLALTPESEEFGFALSTLGERVMEDLTDATPIFSFDPTAPRIERKKKRRNKLEEQIRQRDGDGTVDLHPGPRDVRSMHARGLYPKTVVSRCLIQVHAGTIECLLAQHIDVYREDVARHVRAAAVVIAEELGGVIRSPLEWYDTTKGTIQEPLTVFEIKRSWKGSLDEYLVQYCLN